MHEKMPAMVQVVIPVACRSVVLFFNEEDYGAVDVEAGNISGLPPGQKPPGGSSWGSGGQAGQNRGVGCILKLRLIDRSAAHLTQIAECDTLKMHLKQRTATHYMSNTTEARCSNAKTRNHNLHFVLRALFGIPVVLLCSCSGTPVKHYTLASQGPLQSAGEAMFKVTEKPAMKPFVKIDGHYFSVGSELEEMFVDGFVHPFLDSPMRSLDVRLSSGPHKVDLAIAYFGSWSLPFSEGRSISFEAIAGKSYELQFDVRQFNDLRATGNIEWGAKVVESDTGKEFTVTPVSTGQL